VTAVIYSLLLVLAANAAAEPTKLPSTIAGFHLDGDPSRYGPNNLFDYIDGGADAFLQYDFEELLAASYVDAQKRVEITVDIYRLRTPTRAFGMYTQERPAASTAIPVGVEGNAGSDHLEFVVGAYYVKLAQASGKGGQGEKDRPVLRLFAEQLAAKLPGTREAPAVLGCFPSQGKRARAEKLIARDFLGHAFLHDATVVPYSLEGGQVRLFAVEGKDEADVRTMVERYHRVAKAEIPSAKSTGSATIKDPLNGEVLLKWRGLWLWGALSENPAQPLKTSPQLLTLIDELGRKLSLLSLTNTK
jgi:hypothetical protein